MGVKHLQNFMTEDLPGGFFEVNMKKEIEAYKKTHNDSPKLVINHRAIMGYVCPEDNNKGVLFGGRFQIFAKRFNDVFTKLKECGAELIFINDGPSGKFKTVQWCDTNDTTYEITSRIFDSIYDGTCVQEILGEFEYIPRLKGITEALEPKKFGKLYKPLSGLSRNNTIATYASKHKALAVLSDDSDFLIHSGQWKFWSLNRMNSRELTTNEYNKQLLRQKLDLSDREMCMLATLLEQNCINMHAFLL